MIHQRFTPTLTVAIALLCCTFTVSTGYGLPQAAAGTNKENATKIEVKSTLENLMAAFNGESNASAKYIVYAKKADGEGFGKVASLFRAASKAESIHAQNHAQVIKKLGGVPKADIQIPAAKSTKENLAAAIEGETYEFTVMYPAFIKKAKEEKNREAVRTMNLASNVEMGHAKLYKEALDNLEAWKAVDKGFFVCPTCGNTVVQVDFAKCPICFEPNSEFLPVK